MFRRTLVSVATLAVIAVGSVSAFAQSKEIRIALIASKTGPLEA